MGNTPEILTLADNESDDFGQYCSHDISGYAYGFAFYEASEGNLVYQVYYTDTMGTSRVEPDTNYDVGQYCSLEFSSGVPAISYYDKSHYWLKFAKYNGSTWDVEVVDDGGEDEDAVGRYTSLSYKSSSVPTIAYYNDSDGDPWLAIWNTSTSEWDRDVIPTATQGNFGEFMSHDWIGGTKAGFSFGLRISTPPTSTVYLRFIYYDGENYTDLGSPGGRNTSLVWEDADTCWISHLSLIHI